jgi:hypothetical protein
MWIALILAVWSAVMYFRAFWLKIGDRILAGTSRLTEGEKPEEEIP